MSQDTAQAITGYLLQSLEREYPTTRKILGCVPDGKGAWRPHEKAWTAAELAWHVASSEIWFLESIAAGKFAMEQPPQPPATTAEIVAYYEKAFPAAVAKVKALSAEALSTKVDFFGMFNLPAFGYLTFTAHHSIHHRGQLSTYLRSMNEKVPSIYGPSADEPIEALKAQSAG